jgi:hypothetical protein
LESFKTTAPKQLLKIELPDADTQVDFALLKDDVVIMT